MQVIMLSETAGVPPKVKKLASFAAGYPNAGCRMQEWLARHTPDIRTSGKRRQQ